MGANTIGWIGIVRLGLVQAALGAIVVLTTSTLNRVMVVELALPAILPGALVALHFAMQLLRPRMGYGSDVGQRRTPWIIGGMATLAVGGAGAAVATAFMADHFAAGLSLAIVSFVLIGGGVSAAGTSLLVLLAKRVDEHRRAAAATVVWIMMIAGFAITATLAGKWLDPYSPERLVTVTAGVSLAAFLLTLVAIWRVEGTGGTGSNQPETAGVAERAKPGFRQALAEVWSEPDSRHFTIFVFVSMLAYSAQDLILEPFAGAIFAFTPGESTKLSGVQHGGVLAGMLLVAFATSVLARGQRASRTRRYASLKAWTIGGCVASALALAGLVCAGMFGLPWPLKENVFLMGLANGVFSIAAIGSMMAMAGQGHASREGVRMGLWGAAQAIAFGVGGFLGTVLSDLAKLVVSAPGGAYSVVFALETIGFLLAAALAVRIRIDAGSADQNRFSIPDQDTPVFLPSMQAAKGND